MPLDMKIIFSEYIRILFGMIKDHTRYLLDGFNPLIEDINTRGSSSTDEEYKEAMAEEIAALTDLRDETIPLLLIRSYSAVEKITYNFVTRLTGKAMPKNRNKMQYAKSELKKNGIIWSSLNGVSNVEVTRLLVNCYKHNDSKIDSAGLANVISQSEGEKIRWARLI